MHDACIRLRGAYPRSSAAVQCGARRRESDAIAIPPSKCSNLVRRRCRVRPGTGQGDGGAARGTVCSASSAAGSLYWWRFCMRDEPNVGPFLPACFSGSAPTPRQGNQGSPFFPPPGLFPSSPCVSMHHLPQLRHSF